MNSGFSSGQLGDRWVEVDLDWFFSGDQVQNARLFSHRVAPIFKGSTADFGVIVNIGWISDLIYLWTGDAKQTLPLESSRLQKFKGATYGDLRSFFQLLSAELATLGFHSAKLGIMVVGLGAFVFPEESGEYYDITSEWKRRQPHLYAKRVSEIPATDLDPRLDLKKDTNSYAAYPEGIADGLSFATFVSKQWGALARFLSIEVLHLRDGWFGPMIYRRSGYYGTRASDDPIENATWSSALARVCEEIKLEKPDTFLILYSSALGANVENLIGCIDMEKIVHQGHVDAFIDQSWGGAWQDWWPMQSLGWTFQLQNILSHAAELRRGSKTKARHYYLIETFDGWEPWDTLHRTQGKLQWAIWAYAHAMAKTREGLQPADGIYISWMNNPHGELLSEVDIEFLATEIQESVASALSVIALEGVTVVHNREAIDEVLASMPSQIQGLLWEDDLAMAAKWGFPIGPVVHIEEIGKQDSVQYFPRPLSSQVAMIESSLVAGTKVMLSCNAEQLPTSLRKRLGITVTQNVIKERGFDILDLETETKPGWDVVSLDSRLESRAQMQNTRLSLRSGEPLIVSLSEISWWQPPVPTDQEFSNVLTTRFGTIRPFKAIAEIANEYLGHAGRINLERCKPHETIVVQAWKHTSHTYILLGNVESGVIGDSMWGRRVTVNVPNHGLDNAEVKIIRGSGSLASASLDRSTGDMQLTVEVPPEGLTLIEFAHGRDVTQDG